MAAQEPPWHAAFPAPTVTAPAFKKENLLRLYQTLGDVLSAGMLLVDLRRTDYEGGTIRGSLNIPAQSFYFNMGTLYRLCKGDGVSVISRVIFYCGSSSGQAPRCAAWLSEYVAKRAEEGGVPDEPKCFVLEGGIKAFALAGEPYTRFIDAYLPQHWQQFFESNKRTIDTSVGDSGAAAESDSPTKKARDEGSDDIGAAS